MKSWFFAILALVLVKMCLADDDLVLRLDFSESSPNMSWWSPTKKEDTCSIGYVTNAITGKRSLMVSWDGKGNWMHAYAEPLPSKIFEFDRLGVWVTVTVTEKVPIKECNLRFQDSERETFTFPKKVCWTRPGVYKLFYVVDGNDLSKARIVKHRKTANGKIDLPMSSLGINLVFHSDCRPGSVVLDSIMAVALPRENLSMLPDFWLARPFCDLESLPMLLGRGGDAVLVNNSETGCKSIQCKAVRKTDSLGVDFCRLGSPNGALAPKFPRCSQATLALDIVNEMPLSRIRLKIVDTHAGIASFDFDFPELSESGKHTVSLPLPSSFSSNDRRNVGRKVNAFALAGIEFRAKDKFMGSVLVESIRAKVKAVRSDMLSLDLDTGSIPRVVSPDTCTVRAILENKADCRLGFSVDMRLMDFRNDQVGFSDRSRLSLDAGERKVIDIPVPRKQGIYYVVANVEADGDGFMDNRELRRSFGVLRLVGATPDEDAWPGFCFGSVCHLNPYFGNEAEIVRMADAMSQIGLKILRTNIRIGSDYDFEWYDKIVDIFSRRGMNFDMILGYRARPDGSADYDRSLAEYRKLFSRYKGRVRFWEMLNEPDVDWGRKNPLGSDSYAELSRRTSTVLREIDPSAVFMSAGFCCFDHKVMGKFQRDAMGQCWQSFDLHCFHGHGPYRNYVSMIDDKLMKMRDELGIGIPWYSNETALTMSLGVGEKTQAETQFKKTLFAWSRGARGFTWYNMRGKGENDDDGEHGYGMLTMKLDPRAVYCSWNAFTALYRGMHFREELKVGDGNSCFVLESEKQVVAGFWRDRFYGQQLLLRTDASKAYVSDMFGNRQQIKINDGKILLDFVEEPQSLILPSGSSLGL